MFDQTRSDTLRISCDHRGVLLLVWHQHASRLYLTSCNMYRHTSIYVLPYSFFLDCSNTPYISPMCITAVLMQLLVWWTNLAFPSGLTKLPSSVAVYGATEPVSLSCSGADFAALSILNTSHSMDVP